MATAASLAGMLLFVPGVVLATPAPRSIHMTAPAVRAQGPPQRDRDVDRQLAATMEQLMVLRLAKHLELTEEQEKKVVPYIKELTTARREHAVQRREAIRALTAMSRDPGTDDRMIRERLEAFQKEEQRFRTQEGRTLDTIRSQLGIRQQARLLAFEERFREEMRRRFEDARRRRGGPMTPRRPAVDRRPGSRPPGDRRR